MTPALPVIGCDDPATFASLMAIMLPLASEWHHVSLRTGEMMKHALNGFPRNERLFCKRTRKHL